MSQVLAEFEIETKPGGLGRYDHMALCTALGIKDDPARVVVEQDGMTKAFVVVYDANPLASTDPPCGQDLLMDSRGRIIIGRYHDGNPVYLRLFDMLTGSAQRMAIFGTTGAGKSRSLQLILAAFKANGIVTWLADLKKGQSVPEANGHVEWRATTPQEAIHQLRAAVRVAEDRMDRYAKLGRTAFIPDDPDPLLFVVLDEANRLLEKSSRYRKEAAALIKDLSRAGRSVGVGVIIAAQASHLEELGGSDTLRAMIKEGEVILLRWTSSLMRQLVSDGLLPQGVRLQPIPKYLGGVKLRSRFDTSGHEDGASRPGTQGSAYHVTGEHPMSLFRFSRVGSIAATRGLDPQILALYGDGPVPTIEAASVKLAGEQYAIRGTGVVLPLNPRKDKTETAGGTKPSGDADDDEDVEDDEDDEEDTDGPRRLSDRILDVLAAGPKSTYEVLTALKSDGGSDVRPGSVRNALTDLKQTGAITTTDGTHSRA
ncbi:DNA/RNA helicase domain-containing protein [Streptomyces violaceusniger]|uniref:DNA/RNA helicase domain-containing protein n=1 Tax=Streptomyces violaceusniger TaxID=68280 RepID=UPI003444C2F6